MLLQGPLSGFKQYLEAVQNGGLEDHSFRGPAGVLKEGIFARRVPAVIFPSPVHKRVIKYGSSASGYRVANRVCSVLCSFRGDTVPALNECCTFKGRSSNSTCRFM